MITDMQYWVDYRSDIWPEFIVNLLGSGFCHLETVAVLTGYRNSVSQFPHLSGPSGCAI